MARDLIADQAMLNEVLALANGRDWPRAAAIAERALAEGFEHPLLLNVAATRLEHDGKFEDSLRLLERAVAIAPRDVPARNALALCLQRLNRPADALVQVDELLRQHPQLAFAHASKGNALIALGALGRAKLSHLRALELEPGNLAALASLASIASHRGEHAEARTWAEQVLARVPGFPDAVLSLAAAELADGATAKAETLVRGVLADPRVAASDKTRANGLLGDVLDAAGRYPEAFDAYRACNEALRHAHQRWASEPSVLAYARSLTAAMTATAPHDWSGGGAVVRTDATAREHVFVLGFPRSGTTLLEVVLDRHPLVVSLEEHELLVDGVHRFMREPLDLAALARADERELDELRAAYWQHVREAHVDVAGKVFVDKHPLNTLKLPLIGRLFPRAKVLFACRDPRDVVLSCFRRRFMMNAAMFQLLTLAGGAAFYDAVMEFAECARPRLGLDWRIVRYETLVDAFAGETRDICEFIGLEWVAEMGEFARHAQLREHATPSTAQLASGLNRSGVEHWRHYADALRPILAVLAPWAAHFGYDE